MNFQQTLVFLKCCLYLSVCLLVTACTTSPPSQQSNVCHIFQEKKSWYKKAKRAEKRWGSSIPTVMAMMRQESSFHAKAKPPRRRILGFIPGSRLSSAYGYSQALDSTWRWYKKETGRSRASRSDFGDAIDFVGWYNRQTQRKNGVSLSNTYALYLAYHEGHAGFRQRTYRKKSWLRNVARKVESQAQTYQRQLSSCERKLKRRGWRLF